VGQSGALQYRGVVFQIGGEHPAHPNAAGTNDYHHPERFLPD
jgi:hypothetical protein